MLVNCDPSPTKLPDTNVKALVEGLYCIPLSVFNGPLPASASLNGI